MTSCEPVVRQAQQVVCQGSHQAQGGSVAEIKQQRRPKVSGGGGDHCQQAEPDRQYFMPLGLKQWLDPHRKQRKGSTVRCLTGTTNDLDYASDALGTK